MPLYEARRASPRRAAPRTRRAHRISRGFTYLAVLVAVALLSIGLLAVSEVWTSTAQREKLAQLDWVGGQYKQAIGRYYYANTGSVSFYPPSLEDLLEDKRYLTVRRHLRTLYANPMTGQADWELISGPTSGVAGIAATVYLGDEKLRKEFIFSPGPPFR